MLDDNDLRDSPALPLLSLFGQHSLLSATTIVTCGACTFSVESDGVLRRTGSCSTDCTSISLTQGEIREISAGAFEGLSSLQYLNLHNNQL